MPVTIRVAVSPGSMFSPDHAPVDELYEPELGVKIGEIASDVLSVSVRLLTAEGPPFVTVTV